MSYVQTVKKKHPLTSARSRTCEKHFMLRFMRVVSRPWEAIMSREIVLYWREFRSFRPCRAELSPLKFSCSLAISLCRLEISPIRSWSKTKPIKLRQWGRTQIFFIFNDTLNSVPNELYSQNTSTALSRIVCSWVTTPRVISFCRVEISPIRSWSMTKPIKWRHSIRCTKSSMVQSKP